MLAINRKALRDVWHLRWQFLAIALVMGCGVGVLIMSWSMLASLRLTQDRYYEEFRLAHVFATLKRAPGALTVKIAQIPGVAQVETRVVRDVNLDLAGVDEPAIGRLISLSDRPADSLNAVSLRAGRLPERRSPSEALISEAFAEEHNLRPGSQLFAVLNGRRQRLDIVGVALSPEYVYQVRQGEVIPNNRTFGVFWMHREPLATAFDLDGAFNDVTLYLTPQAYEADVIERLDAILEDFGGRGAYSRADQASNRYVTNELRELQNMGYFAPVIFLVVAAFLLNIVLSRIIALQQAQIAALRAFGYSRREIGWHYVQMSLAVVVVGLAAGVVAGAILGRGMTQIYSHYFHFPVLQFRIQPGVVLASAAISVAAALSGISIAVWRAMNLPPAIAMQPEPPAAYRLALVERWGLAPRLAPVARMVLRNLERNPVRTSMSTLGLGLAVGVIILGNYAADAVAELMEFQFWGVQRYDVAVSFTDPVDSQALLELERLPGVLRSEPMRAVATELRFGRRVRRQDLWGLNEQPDLFRLVDRSRRVHSLPEEGLLLSSKLAELLGARLGDVIEVKVQELERPVVRLPVLGLIDDMVGTSAYIRIDVLRRILREGDTVSGAFLSVDTQQLPELYRRLKATPRVAGVTSKLAALWSLQDTLARTLLQMRVINLGFACVIACGVVYNCAQIVAAERARDLASMRVLGYTHLEISAVFLGELGLITLAAIPLGLALGYGLVALASLGYDTELFRIPVIVHRSTYGLAAGAILTATTVAALWVRRRLDNLDLVAVLKARE